MGDENNDRLNRMRNMQSIMKFCTEITAREDNTVPSTPMNPERRQFLENVFTELQSGSRNVLADCLNSLLNDAVVNVSEEVSEQEDALDQLSEYAPDLNYSCEIFKIGGFPVIIRCLTSPHAILRSKAAALIGDICQNDEELQKEMILMNVVPLLLTMVDQDDDDNCRTAALFGVSCIVRNSESGEEKFIENDGLSYLMRAAQSPIIKLCLKSIFLLSNLITKNKHSESIINMGFVEQLSSVLNKSCDDIVKEHTTNALLMLAQQSSSALQECLRTELYLIPYLQDRLTILKNKPEYQEENEYCNRLLTLMRTDQSDDSYIR